MIHTENEELYKQIGLTLRKIRISNKVSIPKMAKELNRSIDFVRHAETGRFRIPLEKLYEYCAVLDVKIKDVIPDFIPGSSTETYNKLKNK